MKKRKIAMSVALATVPAASPAVLTACSGDHYSKISFPAQDTSYVVTSQGGSVVSYGNYMYFINGTRGYDDTEGTANVWDEVVKGGLYRAELNGEAYVEQGTELKYFRPAADDEGIEFKYDRKRVYVNDKGEGYGKEDNVVATQKIALKTIGTSGYANGGIFIYDNAVYFATPNNQKNATGTVQSTHTDFFMMPLSGGKPTKLYTTEADTSSSAYAFYKFGDSVYLTVNESGTIVSVKINAEKQKADDSVKFEVNATSVYFPVRETYYNGITTDTPEDFVYFVRAVGEKDDQRAGTAIEAMRPDGSENFVVSMTGATETIEAVRNGVLFYRTSQNGKTYLAYTNLHNQLSKHSDTYKAEQAKKADADKNVHISGQFKNEISSTITSVYPFRADEKSNVVYFAGVTSSNITLYCSNDEIDVVTTTSGTVQFIQNNYLYIAGSASDFYRAPLFKHMEGFGGEAQKIASDTTSAGISCDYAAGYFTYFAQVDQWASGYTYLFQVDGKEGLDPIFVGQRAAIDIPTEEQVENVSGGSSES